MPGRRWRLLRAAGWFQLVHTLILCAVGTEYLTSYGWPEDGLARLYVPCAYLGHFFTLSFVPALLVVLPLALILPRPRLVLGVGVLLAAVVLAFVTLDRLEYGEYRMHLTGLIAPILGARTWGFGVVFAFIALAFYSLLASWCWRRFERPTRRHVGPLLGLVMFGSAVASQGIHMWADVQYNAQITAFSHCLPYYRPVTAKSFFIEKGWVDLLERREEGLVRRNGASPGGLLRYPLEPLEFQSTDNEQLNVVLIVVDTLRYGMISEQVAPELNAFSKRAVSFRNHFSGGNSSAVGMFSIFYGLPALYWEAFLGHERSPVLLDVFQEHGYELGIFSSSELYHPAALDRTAFAGVTRDNITEGAEDAPDAENDVFITEQWLDWIDGRDPDRKFFGFLLYDSVAGPSYPKEYEPLFPPAPGATEQERAFSAYQRSILHDDGLVGRVLADLEARGLMDSSVVIVTSDHGQEFDETGLGFKDHGSAFSNRQLHVPFLVCWPGREPAVIETRTSHFDLAPTLLSELFHCTTPPSSYCVGTDDLFDPKGWDWLMVGSYYNTAIVQTDQVMVFYPGLSYEVRDREFRPLPDGKIDGDVIEQALEDSTRFFAP